MFGHKNLFNDLDNTKNNSSFEIYYDGLGFNGWSLRLSNFSLNDVAKNLTCLAGWALSLGTVAANDHYESSWIDFRYIGFSSSDWKTHYKIQASRLSKYGYYSLAPLEATISNGTCNVIFDKTMQNDYGRMNWCSDDVYKKEHLDWSGASKIAFTRIYKQPILEQTETCLKGVIDEAFSAWLKATDTMKIKNAEEARLRAEAMAPYSPYLCAGLSLFAIGAAGYALHRQSQKSRNRLSSTSLNAGKRQDEISYEGEISHDFICTIDRTIMDDRVIANEGHNYDRSGLEPRGEQEATYRKKSF
jgi:hypothetical protein